MLVAASKKEWVNKNCALLVDIAYLSCEYKVDLFYTSKVEPITSNSRIQSDFSNYPYVFKKKTENV